MDAKPLGKAILPPPEVVVAPSRKREQSHSVRNNGGSSVTRAKRGRKASTTEPATVGAGRKLSFGIREVKSDSWQKRQAQNRASQKNFRDRRVQRVKDLENKVAALQSAYSSVVQQNHLLQIEVGRLTAGTWHPGTETLYDWSSVPALSTSSLTLDPTDEAGSWLGDLLDNDRTGSLESVSLLGSSDKLAGASDPSLQSMRVPLPAEHASGNKSYGSNLLAQNQNELAHLEDFLNFAGLDDEVEAAGDEFSTTMSCTRPCAALEGHNTAAATSGSCSSVVADDDTTIDDLISSTRRCLRIDGGNGMTGRICEDLATGQTTQCS